MKTSHPWDRPLTETSVPCQFQRAIDALRQTLNGALRGKSQVVEHVLTCLLARGHLLFDDLPGLGKTTLAKAIAAAVSGHLARVQCTPDLLPADITGFNTFNQATRAFEFREGPVFADVLLADEINRATPRTQSALFEAMAERQVTIDGVTHPLNATFFVIATQNPVDSFGAFPLPEAQLDRFAMKLRIGYPDRTSELEMLRDHATASSSRAEHNNVAPAPTSVVTRAELWELQEHVACLPVADHVRDYLVELAAATRSHPQITLGLSPRGLLLWQRLAQARAHLQRRDFVIPDDIQHVAVPLLEVRLIGDFPDPQELVRELLASVAVPLYPPSPQAK